MSSLLAAPRPMLSRPDQDDLAALMAVRGLCISVLVNTTRVSAWVNPIVSGSRPTPAMSSAASNWSRIRGRPPSSPPD